MQIIIPMEGIGRRFQVAGYKDPKPLIPVDDKPLIEHVISMFPGDNSFIFVCNENHLQETNLRKIINNLRPNSTIVSIAQHKLGPVHSVMQAKDKIAEDEPTIVCYCDINVYWDYSHFANEMAITDPDACLIVFKGFHPPLLQDGFYCTARINDQREVIEVREKYSFTPNKMDSWNSAGIHYFKKGSLIKKYFNDLIEQKIVCSDEYFVSLVHNLLIKDGLKNTLYPVDYFVSWGKPEDLREYDYWSRYFNAKA